MTGTGALNRAQDRAVNVAFRLSREERDTLRATAASHDMSVQSYLEWKVLGRKVPGRRPSGPTRHDTELPMTG